MEPYSISLKLGNDVYESEGKTMYDALKSLPKPAKIMAKGVMTVAHGKQKREHLMMPPRVKRLYFTSTPSLQVLAKQLEVSLK
jgi:hypothetical protein